MKSILIICYGHLTNDPRVLKQIDSFSNNYKIILAGFSRALKHVDDFVLLNDSSTKSNNLKNKLLKLRNFILGDFMSVYWNYHKLKDYEKLVKYDINLILANDMEALPISVKLSENKKSPIIFDAHEYYPGYLQKKNIRTFFHQMSINYICNASRKQVDLLTTVSTGIQKMYLQEFGVKSVLVTNASDFQHLNPTDVNKFKIHMVHHGIPAPGRKINEMIDMFNYLDDRFVLHFYLLRTIYTSDHFDYLVNYSKKFGNRIIFHDPVPTEDISTEINKYDIGLYIVPPTNINYKYGLPNKFFEFIQGRLAIAVGPTDDMKILTEKYDLGVVSSDFTGKSLAEKLNELSTEKIYYYKCQSHRYAKELSSETNHKIYFTEAKKLLSN